MISGPRLRLAWGVLDQIVVSFSSMLVLVLVARNVTPEAFGAFGIAMEAYLVIVFMGRGLSSDPLATAHATDAPAPLHSAARAGAAVTLAMGVVALITLLLTALLIGDLLGSHLLVLAVSLPGLLVLDFTRNVFIVRERPAAALVLDALWLTLLVPSLAVAISAGHSSVTLLAVWAVCGHVVALVALAWAGLVPGGFSSIRAWLLRHRRLWPYYLMENVVFRATILLVMAVLTFSAGLDAVAALRAATAIFAPVAVIGRGMVLVSVPELARQADDPSAIKRGVLVLALLLTPLPLLLGGALVLAPEDAGEFLFGETWSLAAPLVLLTAVSAAASMYTIAAAVGLRASQAARAGLTARTTVALLSLVAALIGGWTGGAFGAALAMALIAPLQVAVWWDQLRRTTRNGLVRSRRGE